jgi:hypothetical protein
VDVAPRPAAASDLSGPPERAADPAAGAPGGDPAAPAPDSPRRLLAINRAGRLELPKDAAASASQSMSGMAGRAAARRRSAGIRPTAPASAPPPESEPERVATAAAEEHAGNGAAAEAEEANKPVRRSRKTKSGLPEGWIIDEEGFVVPGTS